MKLTSITFVLTLISVGVKSEGITWFDGVIVLAGEERVLVGQLAVSDEYDLVLFREEGITQVYPAHRVRDVRCFDEAANINRHFVSVTDSEICKGSRLFEVVLDGQVMVLRRAKAYAGVHRSDRHDYVYFVKQGDQLLHMRQFRSKVYPSLLLHGHDAIVEYRRAMKLNPNHPSDAIQLIDYYNDLVRFSEKGIARGGAVVPR